MVENNYFKVWTKNILFLSIMIGISLYMLILSWTRWADVINDFGRELYVAWQLSNGMILNQDIMYLKGSFSPFLNALLFKIFGTSLMTVALFNLTLIFILAGLIYLIFLETTDEIVAYSTTTTFLGIFAFSQYVGIGNYNYVTPYSHEWTHGILLSFLSIYSFIIYLKRNKNIWLGITGVCIGLVFLTRVEVFLSISIAVISGLLLLVHIEKLQISDSIKRFGVIFSGCLFPVICFSLYLYHHTTFDQALSSIITQYKIIFATPVISNVFYTRNMGINMPLTNFIKLLKTAGWYILIPVVFVLTSLVIQKISMYSNRMISIIIKIVFTAISIFFLIILIDMVDIFRALPLLTLILGGCYFVAIKRHEMNRGKIIELFPIFILAVFGFFMLLRMILNTHVSHYGFAMAMPAVMLLVMLLVYHLPLYIGNKFGNHFFIRMNGLLLLGVIIILHINVSKFFYNKKTYTVGHGGDTILTYQPRIASEGLIINLALEKIDEIISPNEEFFAIPFGINLNYLSRRKNRCFYTSVMPTTLLRFGENKIIKTLETCLPDYILLVGRGDMSIFGYGYFGHDLGVKILSWVKRNYVSVTRIGEQPLSGQGFGIEIFKLKEKTNYSAIKLFSEFKVNRVFP